MVNSVHQWLMISLFTFLHPFFISVIEINHNAKEKSVEVSVRAFVDDVESTLSKNNNVKVDLNNPKDKAALDQLIAKYMTQKIQISIDGKPQSMQYIGYEVKQESVWVYFEIEHINTLKKVDVHCNLLYDFQQKQINIFHVKANGKEKSYKLEYPKTIAGFEL
jgi:hypothetical protein